MKDINEVLSKLSKHRIGCPDFVLAELERLYGEVDSLQQQLAERDRTIARLRKALEEARKIEFSQDILATVQEEDLTEVRAQLREAQQTIAQLTQKIREIESLLATGWYEKAQKSIDEILGE
ncbi:hypothetical protein ACFQ5D_17985 [Paenibacillus farraposensis]|uniref:Uncharacterized protein n=1 Tax=Paenibacillus farraposensis TaxID=2807095 RepID=A0ABW4DFA9_9BACL|nr:hypothetical protein [Paenibacillus farraposensis]MCC3381922.1 hypothetical protein [Paenibacillus farraposensis]